MSSTLQENKQRRRKRANFHVRNLTDQMAKPWETDTRRMLQHKANQGLSAHSMTLVCNKCGREAGTASTYYWQALKAHGRLWCKCCGSFEFRKKHHSEGKKKLVGDYDHTLVEKKFLKKLPPPEEGL